MSQENTKLNTTKAFLHIKVAILKAEFCKNSIGFEGHNYDRFFLQLAQFEHYLENEADCEIFDKEISYLLSFFEK